jgi:hypothetical protein
MTSWTDLRLRRLRYRVTRREMARALGCNESWLKVLELGVYQGDARTVWADKYEATLNEIIEEKKARVW